MSEFIEILILLQKEPITDLNRIERIELLLRYKDVLIVYFENTCFIYSPKRDFKINATDFIAYKINELKRTEPYHCIDINKHTTLEYEINKFIKNHTFGIKPALQLSDVTILTDI